MANSIWKNHLCSHSKSHIMCRFTVCAVCLRVWCVWLPINSNNQGNFNVYTYCVRLADKCFDRKEINKQTQTHTKRFRCFSIQQLQTHFARSAFLFCFALFSFLKLISICLRLRINDWHKMLRNFLLHLALINQWLPVCFNISNWFTVVTGFYDMMGYDVLAVGIFVWCTHITHQTPM